MKIIFTEAEREALDVEQFDKLDDDGAIEIETISQFASEFEDVGGLKNALREERAARKDFEKKARTAEGRLAVAQDESNVAEKDARISQLEAALADKETEIGTLKTEIKDTSTRSKIVEAVSRHKGDVELLTPHLKAKLEENPDLDLDSIMPEFKEKHPGAFKATDHSGGGGGHESGGPASGSRATLTLPKRRSQMTDREKVDYQNEHGLDALMDLPQ